MHDGPHGALSLPPKWKKAVKCACSPAFESEEVENQVISALIQDCLNEELPDFDARIRDIIEKYRLFYGSTIIKFLENLRESIPEKVMCNQLLEHFIAAIRTGKPIEAALQEAEVITLRKRAESCLHDVKKQYLLGSCSETARYQCRRMEKAIRSIDYNALVRKIFNLGFNPVHKIKKHVGLDDGVQYGG